MVECIAADAHKSWLTELRRQDKAFEAEQWDGIGERDKELFRVVVRTVVDRLSALDKFNTADFTASMGVVVGHSWHELKIPAGPMVPKDIHLYLAASKDGLVREDKFTTMLVMGYLSVLVGLQSGIQLTAEQVEANISAVLGIAKKEKGR
jgi:hypothetical protein